MSLKDSPELYRAYLVKVDMRLFSHFADFILENGIEAYAELSLTIKLALKIALVMCYSRPFTSHEEDYGVDREGFEATLTQRFLNEERVIHKNILEIHERDVGRYSPSIRDVDRIESKIVHIAMSRNVGIPLEYSIVECMKKMSDKISAEADRVADYLLENDVYVKKQPANEI